MRKTDIYLKDILKSVNKILKYSNGLTFNEFKNNDMIQDAIIRNLEIIGEAVKKIPMDIRNDHKNIEW